MNLTVRLQTFLYSLANIHKMAWELSLLPVEWRISRRDAQYLRQQIADFSLFREKAEIIYHKLEPFYKDYTSTTSPGAVTISLELSCFLMIWCNEFKPRTILDLGSGFSSFVFRYYGRGAEIKPTIYSVDESPRWVERTRHFLSRQNVDTENLTLWDSFAAQRYGPYDLILQDFGTYDVRKELLPQILTLCRKGGAIILDDMHVPDYRITVARVLSKRKCEYFSLRSFTRTKRRLRYSMLVMP